jgi:hypothetical protein
MAKRTRTLYGWQGRPGEGTLERVGEVSEAKLRAWEYRESSECGWTYADGFKRDVVRVWRTARPDLAPEALLVGDVEELAAG